MGRFQEGSLVLSIRQVPVWSCMTGLAANEGRNNGLDSRPNAQVA